MKLLLRVFSFVAVLVALASTTSAQVTLTASASTKAVLQGGQVTFEYQVCNDRKKTITGGVYYKANGPVFVDLTLVQSGSVASMACSPNLSFTLNVPASAPAGNYVFLLEARFNPSQSPVASARFNIQVTPAARPAGKATEWSVASAEPWPTLEEMRGGGITLTASSNTATVPQGGQVTFTYQVCNNGDEVASGVTFYRVLLIPSGSPVTGYFTLESGSLAAMTCSPNLSFTVNVPANASPGMYNVRIQAGPAVASAVAGDLVPIEVTPAARPVGSGMEWALVSYEAWPSLEAAATTTVASDLSAYPNPFTRQTTLAFTLDEAADVRLAVYDVLGREVAVLADGLQEAGAVEADFEAADLPSGVYVVHLAVGGSVETVPVTLVR